MTTIKLELTPELEQQLQDEAARQGLDPNRYIINTLQERLHHPSERSASLTKAEADLLQKINLGLLPETWDHYHALIAKRRAETLMPEEQAMLIEISDQIEQANALRMQALIELATLQGKSLETIMQALGIEPSTYA